MFTEIIFFRKGYPVKLKENIDTFVADALKGCIEQGKLYKVFYVSRTSPKTEDIVWIGPKEMDEDNVLDFSPEKCERHPYNGRVFPVAAAHLKSV